MIIRGEHFKEMATHTLVYYDKVYCDPGDIQDGDIIYCDTHQLHQYKDMIRDRQGLTIITHNSDGFVCDETPWRWDGVSTKDFNGCYDRWFAQNSYSTNPKVIPIPIGFENKRWESVFGPKTRWLEMCDRHLPSKSVYLNCNTTTNPDRKMCYELFGAGKTVDCEESVLQYTDYLDRIVDYKFVISPEGNGLDCHRTWEVMYLGRIPIIKKTGRLEHLYKNMPVLVVEEWTDVLDMDIDQKYTEMSARFKCSDFLTTTYWKDRILL